MEAKITGSIFHFFPCSQDGNFVYFAVRIIARSTIRDFWQDHKDAEQPLKSWFTEAKKASWTNPHQIKTQYRSASILKSGRIVFNIAGNKYRLVVRINYAAKIVYIRFIGTHEQYDTINPEEI